MALPPTPHRPFGAVLTAMVTPMKTDYSIDFDAAAQLAVRLIDDGCDGIVLSGTTGESPTTHSPEKAELVRVVVDAIGKRAAVLAGACSNDTAHAVRMAAQAAEAGADGLLVVTPYYSRPSQTGIEHHVRNIADATDLPVMVYDIPGRAGVRIAPDTYLRLAEHPRVVATKDATGDVYAAAKLAQATGLAWYSGDDALLMPFLVHGGAGIVSVAAHVVSGIFASVVRHLDAGNLAAALTDFLRAAPVVDALNGSGFQAVATKAALELLGAIPTRQVRLPNVAASNEDIVEIRHALVTAGFLPVEAVTRSS